jgi:FkbM family methyltransferase
MNTYAQNKEDLFIQNYFGDYKGTLLSVGENNGLDLSNARALLEQGWSGHLVEPSSVFYDLKRLYLGNRGVFCYNVAVGEQQGIVDFYESGAHVPNGTDKALVSTLDFNETQRWANVEFNKIKVNVVPFNFLWEMTDFAKFDFISIDAEGFDLAILRQIDLCAVGCKCLIIEHNGDEGLKTHFCEYCEKFGLSPVLVNAENIIFIRKT